MSELLSNLLEWVVLLLILVIIASTIGMLHYTVVYFRSIAEHGLHGWKHIPPRLTARYKRFLWAWVGSLFLIIIVRWVSDGLKS